MPLYYELNRLKLFLSFELGEDIVIDVLEIWLIFWLGQLLVDSALELAQVLRLEELELVGDLVHLALLFERERLLHPGQGKSLHLHCELL